MATYVEQVEAKDSISDLTLRDIANNVKASVSKISDKSLGDLFHDAGGKFHGFMSGIADHLKESVPKIAKGALGVFTGKEIAENTVEHVSEGASRLFATIKDTIAEVKNDWAKDKDAVKDKEAVEVANEEYEAEVEAEEENDFTLKEAVGRSVVATALVPGFGAVYAGVRNTLEAAGQFFDGVSDKVREDMESRETAEVSEMEADGTRESDTDFGGFDYEV